MRTPFGACLAALVGLVSLASGCSSPTQAQIDMCPTQIEVTEQIASLPSGWSAGRDTLPARLKSVALYDGDPAANVALIGDSTSSGASIVDVWTLPLNPPRGVYLVCRYDGTRIMLQKRLDPGVKECRVTTSISEKVGGAPAIQLMSCN